MKNNRNLSRRNQTDFEETFEKIGNRQPKSEDYGTRNLKARHGRIMLDTQDFKCVHCGAIVCADRALSGVNNRNHCPNCLWSRHVDLCIPGDRKAVCKSRMQPIGVTAKHTIKRYGIEKNGELMLVHKCTGCDKYSINRIAADDDPQAVYRVFRKSIDLTEEETTLLNREGIFLLGGLDLTTVYSQLYGWQSILEEFRPSTEVLTNERVEITFLEKIDPA